LFDGFLGGIMLRDRIRELFKGYDKNIQLVIAQVIMFEQENIDKNTFRYKDDIKNIIDKVLKDET
jgi:hypothetical protein